MRGQILEVNCEKNKNHIFMSFHPVDSDYDPVEQDCNGRPAAVPKRPTSSISSSSSQRRPRRKVGRPRKYSLLEEGFNGQGGFGLHEDVLYMSKSLGYFIKRSLRTKYRVKKTLIKCINKAVTRKMNKKIINYEMNKDDALNYELKRKEKH